MRRLLGALLVAGLLAGCAQSPGGGTRGTTRISFTVTFAGEVNPNFVYLVALRPSVETNPTTQGPIPVIDRPWGNGFVAGNATHFVRFDRTLSPNYGLFRFRNTQLTEWFPVGAPVTFDDVPNGGKTLRFELDLSQIAPNVGDLNTLQSLQINFLSMDRVPRGNDTRRKFFDGLGDSRLPSEVNDFITVSLKASRVYDNVFFGNMEPTGDVVDPDLDITDFRVEVRLP